MVIRNKLMKGVNNIKKRVITSQILKFYSVGSISCIINLVSRYLLNFVFPFVESIFLSSLLAGFFGFILVKHYVFFSTNDMKKELFLYGIISIFGIFFVTMLSAVFDAISVIININIISQNFTYFVIQLLSLGINSIIGFYLCKYVIFTDSSGKHKTD